MANTYSTGTLAVTSGSKAVTISGGLSIAITMKPGDFIAIEGGLPNAIADLIDETHFELVRPFDGADDPAASYVVIHMPAGWGDRIELNEQTAEIIRLLGVSIPFTQEQLDAADQAAANALASQEAAAQSEANATAAVGLAASYAQVRKATWAELAAVVGSAAGQGGEVVNDTGTHTDPVVGGTVSNGGVYSWSASPAGWRRVADTNVGILTTAINKTAEENYRGSLWQFFGDATGTLTAIPTVASEDVKVIASLAAAADNSDVLYRSNLWNFQGDGSTSDPPVLVDEDLKVIAAVSAYSGGGLLNSTAVYRMINGTGQSNALGAASDGAAVVYPDPHPGLFTLQRNGARDYWQTNYTGGGASVEIPASEIDGIDTLLPQLAPAGTGGTTATEAAARALLATRSGPLLCWNEAEGGQTIWNLLPTAGAGAHAFANSVTKMQRAQALKPPGSRIVYDWMLMHQGESNRNDTTQLGKLHNDLRIAIEAQAKDIFGQTESVRMISFQPSSGSSLTSFPSILSFALANKDAGLYFCGGPCYQFPFSNDWLHHTSLGHAMRGELAAAIIRSIEAVGQYLPLHAVSAQVTGSNQITVALSEAAEIATDDVVLAIANHGVTITGATISAVAVSGSSLVITTTDPASGATEIAFGFNPQTSPGSQENVPRTNIRAVAALGTYSWGGLIRAWMCHQKIAIS